MAWIFALGIIGFCIVSVGFRKFVFGFIGVVVLIAGGIMGYYAYEAHVAKQQAAEEDAKERLAAAAYPECLGKDQLVAWLDAGGKCRPATVAQAAAVPAVLPVAEFKRP